MAAHGQSTGTRIPGNDGSSMVSSWGYTESSNSDLINFPKTRAHKAVREISRCMINSHQSESRNFLALNTQDSNREAVLGSLKTALQRCMGGSNVDPTIAQLQISFDTMGGYLAEAFLRSWEKPTLNAVEKVRQSYAAPWTNPDPAKAIVEEMAYCIAEVHPTDAVALIATQPDSPDENQAIKALTPYVPSCLVKGATLKTDAVGLRLAIALSLYHRIVDPLPVPAEPPVEKN
ncbi:MAG: hypothetical protein JSR96_02895 [Proteobacteria bacterium]|nr:hypothetical protein [Pseudomonadota bacterium]